MISRPLRAAMLAALFAIPAMSYAQSSNPLVGSWSIEYERGRRIENGAVTPIMGVGALTVVQRGDSIVGTFTPAPRPDGTTAPPTTVVGRPTGAGTVFVQKQTMQMNMNGEVSTQEITLTWTLKASGDVLSGTLERLMPAMEELQEPTPVKGKRTSG